LLSTSKIGIYPELRLCFHTEQLNQSEFFGNANPMKHNSSLFIPSIPDSRQFIGIWRFVVDLGTMSEPFMVGLITGILSLSGAAFLVATVGMGGAVVMGLLVPETKPRSKVQTGTPD